MRTESKQEIAMNKRRPGMRVAMLAGTFALWLPSLGWAQATTCANATIAPGDGRINGPAALTGGASGASFYFQVATTSGNSYSFEVADTVSALGAGTPPLSLAIFSDAGCSAPVGATNTRDVSPGLGIFNARLSWTATTATSLVRVTVPATTSWTVTWTANDTTLYSPSWSTNGSYDTFYSLRNTTAATLTGTLTLFDRTGVTVTSSPVTIAPRATFSTNTQTLGTVRNQGGTATFVHNGPPGAILAEASIANFTITPTPYNQPIKFQTVREIR